MTNPPKRIPWLDGPLTPAQQALYDSWPAWKKRSIFANDPKPPTKQHE